MAKVENFPLVECRPPLWAPERHSQTILADILPLAPMPHWGDKWQLTLPDQDQLILRVFENDSPWVITLFHGLTGAADAKYMQRVAKIFLRDGHSVVLMNHRNCGEGRGLARHPYHSGRSDDIGYVISHVRKRFPTKKVLAVGFSMSASALLLLLSQVLPTHQIFSGDRFLEFQQTHDLALPDAAITVNAPIHLEKASKALSVSLNRIYEMTFMSSLHYLIKDLERSGQLSPTKGLHPLMKVTHFDSIFTAPRAGFSSAHDFYQTCSAFGYLDKISKPTVCLMSQTDPFIDFHDYLEAPMSPMVRLHLEKHGGHMGYLHREKTPLGTNRWLDYGIYEIGNYLMRQS